MRKTLFIALLILASPVWGQLAKKKADIPSLFSIQATPVSAEEFIYLYRKNHFKPEDFSEQKIEEYISLFINFKLKVTEAKARGIDTTEVFLKELNTYKEELKRPFTAEKSKLDSLTHVIYMRSLEDVRALHILILVKPEASPQDTLAGYKKIMSILDKIKAGEDFEKAAFEFSEDPSAKSNKGDLGYFSALQMVYQFEEAAYGLKVGEISKPVRTRFGYHLIKVTDRRKSYGEVEVSHILLRTGTGDDTRIKNKIFEIEEQLQGGRSWDELCKEYSDDPSTKEKGGRLRPFGTGALAAVPEFEAVAFSLKEPGEISDPFKSAYGWHIIRLERKIPPAEFKDVEASLQKRLRGDERVQAANAAILSKKKSQFHFSENIDVKKSLLNAADTTLKKGKWKYAGTPSLKALTLFEVDEKKILARDFISYVQKNQSVNSLEPAQYLEQMYVTLVNLKLNEAEENKLVAENVEYRSLLAEYKEGILLFTIMEKEVWNKASEDTVGQRAFYGQHQQKYQGGNRVYARIYTATDKAFMDEVMKKIAAGDSIKGPEAKKFKAIQPARNYERGDNKAIDKVQWVLGLQTTEIEGTYYLISIDNLVPPGLKKLEEVKAQVISDFQDTLEKEWVTALKEKYPVKINNKGKKYVIKQLTEK